MKDHTCQPVFVLGCPRSGTTLLGGFFEPTPWGIGVETHYVTKFRGLAEQTDFNQPQQIERLMRNIIAQRPIMQWKIDWNVPEFIAEHQPASYAELIDAIAMTRAQKHGWAGWVDKTPTYSYHIPYLLKLFPDARFVLIYRDGRDVAHSLLNRSWGPNNIWACAERWRSCSLALHEAEIQVPAEQLHVVKYEELLANPLTHANALYAFLGIQDNNGLAAHVASRVKQDNASKWKRTLTAKQIRLFESCASDVLTALGYEVTHKYAPPGPMLKGFYKTHDWLVWMRFMFKQNVVDGIRIKFFGAEPFNQ